MRLGLCTIAMRDTRVEDALEVAATAGYDAVEVWGRDHVGDRTPDTCEAIRDHAAALGLDVAVYGSYLRPCASEFADRVEVELKVASQLDASLVRVWAGNQEYEERTDDHWDRVVTELVGLADRAADRDLGVTVEKHEGTLTNSTEGARRLVEAVDRDNCGLNWQPLFGFPAEDLLVEARVLAPLSNNVHVQAVPEAGTGWENRCLLEDAHFDVSDALRVFDDIGFDGCVEVEFVTENLPVETAVRRDREFLASILE